MVNKQKINVDLPPGLPPLIPAVRLKQSSNRKNIKLAFQDAEINP
jgi:hypothetical protein